MRSAVLVGLMSGTSADGIDAVVASIGGPGSRPQARVLAHVHRPFRHELRQRILSAATRGDVHEICELNFVLGEQFSSAVLAAVRKAGLQPKDIAAIGSHGQTVHHLPGGHPPSTLQIGEPAVIAERTGITTIADFRVRDVAAGGQGAPLVPYADWVLLSDPKRSRIVQNIGGIANLTFLPAGATLEQVIAFDTGPGNMLIDGAVSALSDGRETMDRGGHWSARGHVSLSLLERLMGCKFIRRTPPKTTGREEFGAGLLDRTLRLARSRGLAPADIVATLTAFTAESIADAYRRFIFPQLDGQDHGKVQVILGGGGAKNKTLCRMLRERTGSGEWFTHEDFGIANQAKEALAFALLAHATLQGRPANVPGATGARHPVILGKVIPA
jgi:anhydro-N-acetylmuramic acid kinase